MPYLQVLPYPLIGVWSKDIVVTAIGHIVNKPKYAYTKGVAAHVYPVSFMSTKEWQGWQFQQRILTDCDAPQFRIRVANDDGPDFEVCMGIDLSIH